VSNGWEGVFCVRYDTEKDLDNHGKQTRQKRTNIFLLGPLKVQLASKLKLAIKSYKPYTEPSLC